MTNYEPPPSETHFRDRRSCSDMRMVWITARSDRERATLVGQMAAYGYSVSIFDAADGLPATSMVDSTAVVIEAPVREESIAARISAAVAITDRPAVLVIDNGLDAVDRILALEAGADDCVMWPYDPRELVARIRAIIRRRGGAGELARPQSDEATARDTLSFGGWTIDRAQRRLSRPGAPAENLPASEFAVLDHLLSHPNKIVSREALLESTASAGAVERRNLRSVDIQVSRLRKRLEIDGDEVIRTVRGRGYLLLPAVAPADRAISAEGIAHLPPIDQNFTEAFTKKARP